jgi:hypothetical protein
MDKLMILDSSVGIATGYGLRGRGSITSRGFFFIPQRWHRLGAHPISHRMDTGMYFPGGKAAWADHLLHVVPRSRMVELYLNSHKYLHGA